MKGKKRRTDAERGNERLQTLARIARVLVETIEPTPELDLQLGLVLTEAAGLCWAGDDAALRRLADEAEQQAAAYIRAVCPGVEQDNGTTRGEG